MNKNIIRRKKKNFFFLEMGGKKSKEPLPDDLEAITGLIKNKVLTDPDTPNKEQVPIEALWKKHRGPTVLVVFRRWGCVVCRLGATEISEVK